LSKGITTHESHRNKFAQMLFSRGKLMNVIYPLIGPNYPNYIDSRIIELGNVIEMDDT